MFGMKFVYRGNQVSLKDTVCIRKGARACTFNTKHFLNLLKVRNLLNSTQATQDRIEEVEYNGCSRQQNELTLFIAKG